MTFKRLLTYLKPYKKSITLVALSITISSLSSLLIPKLTGNIISSMYQSLNFKTNFNFKYLYTLIIIIGVLYLIISIASYLENYIINIVSEKALNNLKNEAYEKLSKLSIEYYNKQKKGEILTRLTTDIDSIASLFTQLIPKLINYFFTFIGIIIMMSTINIKLTFITLILLPLTAISSKLLIKLSKKNYTNYYQKNGNLNALIQESYHCQETISLYNNDKKIEQSFKVLNKDLAKTNIKTNLIANLISPLSSIINYFIYLIIIILGSKYVLEKKILLGDIQALIQYTKQLSSPINGYSSLLISLQSSIAASKRVFELLDEKEEIHAGEIILDDIKTIEFKNVTFSYDQSPLINNFNLKINKGEKIAIIGETGSGKSTIINLLMQFYKVNEGEILINNKPIYEYDLKSYYDNISLIPQDIWLFEDTVENNLKLANFEAKEQDIINACETTNSLNFIKKAPLKFKEIINEQNKLSQGEKQLLILSRALLKKHSLLILDEATSNIDSKNEKEIQESIDKITQEKTTIIIAHKLSTILKADKIIVMKEGNIVETGTPSSLYKQKGEYYSFLQTL